jgi:hypothetical protein
MTSEKHEGLVTGLQTAPMEVWGRAAVPGLACNTAKLYGQQPTVSIYSFSRQKIYCVSNVGHPQEGDNRVSVCLLWLFFRSWLRSMLGCGEDCSKKTLEVCCWMCRSKRSNELKKHALPCVYGIAGKRCSVGTGWEIPVGGGRAFRIPWEGFRRDGSQFKHLLLTEYRAQFTSSQQYRSRNNLLVTWPLLYLLNYNTVGIINVVGVRKGVKEVPCR